MRAAFRPAFVVDCPHRGCRITSYNVCYTKLLREAASRLGTGHGRRETSRAHYVGFERATPYPAQLVQLRYDSRANLVARGVIREPGGCAWPCPRPFPGFAPDPDGP